MTCCKFLSLLYIALLSSDPFNMLTRNAKTSMNSTGKDSNTGKDTRFENRVRFSSDSERDAPDAGTDV